MPNNSNIFFVIIYVQCHDVANIFFRNGRLKCGLFEFVVPFQLMCSSIGYIHVVQINHFNSRSQIFNFLRKLTNLWLFQLVISSQLFVLLFPLSFFLGSSLVPSNILVHSLPRSTALVSVYCIPLVDKSTDTISEGNWSDEYNIFPSFLHFRQGNMVGPSVNDCASQVVMFKPATNLA